MGPGRREIAAAPGNLCGGGYMAVTKRENSDKTITKPKAKGKPKRKKGQAHVRAGVSGAWWA